MSDSTSGHPTPDPDRIRASDTDRDRVAAQLREALAEGRISPDEHSERLDAVYASTTLGELAPITHDLPDSTAAAPGRSASSFSSPRPLYGKERVTGTPPDGRFSLALMGGVDRSGNWTVPPTYQVLALMGGINLDLREARFASQETTIVANALMGGVEIIVPDDIEVRVNGAGIMGGYGFEGGAPSSVIEPGAPVVRVVGVALMAWVVVFRKPRKHQKSNRSGSQRKRLDEDD